MNQDELDKEMFVCMLCEKTFPHIEGTWPQNYTDGSPNFDADTNDRIGIEFVCYDCAK